MEFEMKKPVPELQPWSQKFWEGTKEGKLLIQVCKDCNSKIFYPRKYCPECWSGNLSWIESTGKAKVYTFSTAYSMVEPKFTDELPYTIAYVDLAEGVRMMTRIVECKPEDVHFDMDVEVAFHERDGFFLPYFRPVNGSRDSSSSPQRSAKVDSPPKVAEKQRPRATGEYTTILYDVKGPGCYITLNRPDKYNAINREMASELEDAFRRVRDEASVAVVVLAGNGKAFCTGGDLSVFPSLAEHLESMNWLAHQGYGVGKAIELCEKVVIAKVSGHCLAGGLELALMCDLIYAKESAKFGTTEINMGILPGWGGTARIARALPIYRAREIIYSGRKDYTARDMFEMGFLTRVFNDEEFEQKFGEVVANISSKKIIALRIGKEIMGRSLECGSLDAALTLERNAIQWLIYAPDVQKVMDGFRKKPEGLVDQQKKANVASDAK
jgi:enoyl-CoA hydratase/carnithine racemase/uncharacterized OB-fold protein